MLQNIGEKIKYYLGGREYGRKMNEKMTPQGKAVVENFKNLSLRRKIMTTGGYMLTKIKNLAKGK